MTAITPLHEYGFNQFHLLVNPIQVPKPNAIEPTPATQEVKPVTPTPATHQWDRSGFSQTGDELESFYLLTRETRKALLGLHPDHPQRGPHPTD